MKNFLTLSALALALTACASTPEENDPDHPDVPDVANPDGPKWQLVWEENFDSPEIDYSVWSKIPRGTPEWAKYMSDADTLYSISDGMLHLWGLANVNIPQTADDSAPYLTGGLYTKGKKAFSNGRIEIRARLKGCNGAWPAIWLLPDPDFNPGLNCSWPDGGEIDIMERLNHDSFVYQTVHSGYTYTLGITDNPKNSATGAIKPDEFNTYAVDLYPDRVRFSINNSHTFTYPRIDTDLPGQFPYDKKFYLLIDMQLGGGWVGSVDPAQLPVVMDIDRVSFYQLAEE